MPSTSVGLTWQRVVYRGLHSRSLQIHVEGNWLLDAVEPGNSCTQARLLAHQVDTILWLELVEVQLHLMALREINVVVMNLAPHLELTLVITSVRGSREECLDSLALLLRG